MRTGRQKETASWEGRRREREITVAEHLIRAGNRGACYHLISFHLGGRPEGGCLIPTRQTPQVVSSSSRIKPQVTDSKTLHSFPSGLVPHLSRASRSHNLTHPDHNKEPE